MKIETSSPALEPAQCAKLIRLHGLMVASGLACELAVRFMGKPPEGLFFAVSLLYSAAAILCAMSFGRTKGTPLHWSALAAMLLVALTVLRALALVTPALDNNISISLLLLAAGFVLNTPAPEKSADGE